MKASRAFSTWSQNTLAIQKLSEPFLNYFVWFLWYKSIIYVQFKYLMKKDWLYFHREWKKLQGVWWIHVLTCMLTVDCLIERRTYGLHWTFVNDIFFSSSSCYYQHKSIIWSRPLLLMNMWRIWCWIVPYTVRLHKALQPWSSVIIIVSLVSL